MSVGIDRELRTALETVAAGVGLALDDSFVAAALSALPGPFVTRDVVGSDGSAVLSVAVRDGVSVGADELCDALARAATEGAGAAEGVPVASGADVAARFAGPYEVTALSDGSTVQAVIVTAVERRVPTPAAPGPAATAGLSESVVRAAGGFDKLVNVALDVSVELGRTRVTLSEVLEFDVGSVVELDRAAGAPVDIRVNGTLLAHGEVVLIDDEYAVRITAIIDSGAD